MSKEEEAPGRVTRGALRRMSVDQEPTSTPGTPKKQTTSTKKSAVLDAIQEGSTGPSDVEEDSAAARSTTKGKKDASFIGNKSLQKVKEHEVKPPHRTRAASLTEDNVSLLENIGEIRRTPRRRPSQDTTLTPQTLPPTTRRITRRNSATSDDGNIPATTPKASKSRLSVAPPTIAEDDEKEDKVNSSSTAIAEAELSDLDIRKLRNRAISNSPVPRSSPSGKNTSVASNKGDEGEADASKVSSPAKEAQEPKGSESAIEVQSVSDDSAEKTPTKSEGSKSTLVSPVGSVKRQLKDVTFEEGTPKQLDKSVYPKTPIVPPGEKRRKLSEKSAAEADKSMLLSTPEVIDATVLESPQKVNRKAATPKIASPTKATFGTPKKVDQSLDKSIDMSLASIVEDVRENINQVDQSMSILGTPKPTGKQKSHFSHLREGTFSTPILKVLEIDEEKATSDSPPSKSWTQAVKGTSNDKGIDVFSVRKQEEEQRQEEQTKQLNESLKRKILEKIEVDDDEEEEEEEEEEEDDDAPKRNSFVDDEAMEVKGYESGDSLDSETRAEMDANELDEGESLGSKDSEIDDEEEENDSFIASDDEEFDLLDGSGDDLDSEKEENKSKDKKKHKRIIHQADSSDEEQSVINLDETNASESKSPKKTPKKADLDRSKSLNKTPAKGTPEATSSSKTPKKTPAKNSLNASYSADLPQTPKKTPAKSTPEATANSKTPKKTPAKNSPADDQNQKTPTIGALQEEPATPKTQKKTPSKNSLDAETKQATSAEKHSTKTMENDALADKVDTPKSRKSLPAPALISADFYASAKKATKRNTINVLDSEKVSESAKSTNLVSNPAALALAKKNKRLSLGASPPEAALKKDKRASLPGKLTVDNEIESPLNRKQKKKDAIPEENGTALDAAEPMDVDEYEEVAEESPVKKPAQLAKKKPKDLSEFDTSAILARCNEIVRSDKEKRKQGATLKQKKKDEKRRQREEEQQEEATEANESTEQQKKKKKKKKKPVNYLLEELGETKEEQVAKALQRKMAILEAKRERKKAKKVAKLHQQLNKENQQEEGEKNEGIGAKFEKKTKKDKKAKKMQKAAVEEEPKPVVKRDISAFAMYSAQIEELKKEQADKRKPKSKQLKEKNQQPSAAQEVQVALKTKVDTKSKKDKQAQTPSESAPASDENHKEDKKKRAADKEVSPDKPTKHGKTSSNEPESTSASASKPAPSEKFNEDKSKEVVSEKPTKLVKKKDKSSANELSESLEKKKKLDLLFAPLKSVVSTNDDELATLKKSLMEPVTKVVKKQKLSQNDSNPVTVAESTPPRKLKALSRLELGFHEEPLTPDHKLLKRNHGFKEEPVTPKTIGFKVSNVLPAGQEALQQQAVLAKKNKTYSNSNRIRPEDVKEPAKGLPLPIWTRSGTFAVEELSEAKSKKSKATRSVESDFVPLNVNGGGHCSTDFMVKTLGGKKKEHQAGGTSKAHRIDLATVDESVINFKKQAIFGKNAHLREKKSKH
ncbi:titin-like [Ochlerotatus camptorhynchus]|uniref:titin-like n=1 Tax=Ochlerotatus camptorhynchus TaxID=644619 RepID=UPI0031D0DFD4